VEVEPWNFNLGSSGFGYPGMSPQGTVWEEELYRNVDYLVAAMHPDSNLLFFVQRWDCKMVSYDIDSQEVHALDTDFHHDYEITPYVPYVSELLLGVIGTVVSS
jgi:hypothetical protein